VTVELTGGQKIEGIIVSFDNFSIVLRGEGDRLIYKHAISSISLGEKFEFSESK
jgi:host factor-I protein